MVSVIITTKNEAGHIASCLISVNKQTYEDIETIVVDNGSSDDTRKIAQSLGARVFDKGPERSAQRNYGAEKAKGDYLLFLDADMILTPTVVEECVRKIQKSKIKNQNLRSTNQELLALVIPERSFGEGFWAQCKVLERTYYVGLPWNTGARFFSKKAFFQMDGYDESNTGTEDFDLPQRIEAKFGRESIGFTTSFIDHDEGHLSLVTTCQKKYYYGKKLHRYRKKAINRMKFMTQASIFKRYALYFSKPFMLFKNPFLGVGMLFMKTCEFIAGAMGYVIGVLSTK